MASAVARYVLASRTQVDLARLPSCPDVALGVAQCPGQDPDNFYSRDSKQQDPGARNANVFFYTASLPHLPAVSYDFDEDDFGKKGSVYMGGNALHTAFRLVIDKARAKLDAEGDVISEGTDYSPIQMKLALQNELYNQKPAFKCDKTFNLKCCETERRAGACTHTVAKLPVETKARLGPPPHYAHLPVLALALSRPRRVARASLWRSPTS